MESIHQNKALRKIFNLLKVTFIVLPIVAGADKFNNLLTNWEQYLNTSMANLLPISPTVFMMVVGVIEIIAGVIVFIKPKIGGYIVAGWLTCIALTLLAQQNFYDVAVRDLVIAVSAFSMARLSTLVVKNKIHI